MALWSCRYISFLHSEWEFVFREALNCFPTAVTLKQEHRPMQLKHLNTLVFISSLEYLKALSIVQVYWIKNLKVRNRAIMVLSACLQLTMEQHKEIIPEETVSGYRFETGAFWIRRGVMSTQLQCRVWSLPPCSMLKVKQRFGGTNHLHLQSRRIIQARNGWQRQLFTEMIHIFWNITPCSVDNLPTFRRNMRTSSSVSNNKPSNKPVRSRLQGDPCRFRLNSNGLHGVTSQKR
jgi:hypothetical protein